MDVQSFWQQMCVILQKELQPLAYETWISSALEPLELTGDAFYIKAATTLFYDFVSKRYTGVLQDAAARVAGRPIMVQLLSPEQAAARLNGTVTADRAGDESSLNAQYTFDTFVVGGNSRFAHAAALAVAEAPGDSYNPLFIYGGVGLGKTHLMHAIGNYIVAAQPEKRVRYVPAEIFTNDLIASLNKKNQAQFREKYRNIDVLLIDDIQFIAGKNSIQEEFFHTFEALHTAGKQIVISSDKPPREIARLEERLISRFEWGLIADIAKPDLETRVAILRRKADEEMIKADTGLLYLIAECVTNNVRELEGCLTRLNAYAVLTSRPVDRPLAEEALKEIFARSEPRRVSCDDVMEAVAAYYSVTLEDLRGARRNKEIAAPRQVAMYICREMVGAPLVAIGEAFGGRDHSTVNHACRKVAQEMKTSPALSSMIEDLMTRLQEQ